MGTTCSLWHFADQTALSNSCGLPSLSYRIYFRHIPQYDDSLIIRSDILSTYSVYTNVYGSAFLVTLLMQEDWGNRIDNQ